MVPYPDWLNPGDNAWQLVAATLVGLMSIPGIAVLYGGIVQRKWAVNTMLMAFTGFSLVLVVWVLWGFKMGFGQPLKLGPGILRAAVGIPHTILSSNNQQIAWIPLLDGTMPSFRFSETTLAYFQFVFAAITPLLFLGSVVGRMSFKVWLIFVPLWSTFAYSVNAFLLWGGGWWGQAGALDYSRWLRDPPGGRNNRIRRSRGDRSAAGAGPGARGAEQPAPCGGRCRRPVVGLERVQRR